MEISRNGKIAGTHDKIAWTREGMKAKGRIVAFAGIRFVV